LEYDEYIRMKALIEQKIEETIKVEKKSGITVKELIEWYIESNLHNIHNEETAKNITLTLRSVIQRLINKERSLVICIY